jgi:hypothetical protein
VYIASISEKENFENSMGFNMEKFIFQWVSIATFECNENLGEKVFFFWKILYGFKYGKCTTKP